MGRFEIGDDVVCVVPYQDIDAETTWHINGQGYDPLSLSCSHPGWFSLRRETMDSHGRLQVVTVRLPKTALDSCFVSLQQLYEIRLRSEKISLVLG